MLIAVIILMILGRVWLVSIPEAAAYANLYPMMAMAFIAGAYFKNFKAYLIVGPILLFSDIVINALMNQPLVGSWTLVAGASYLTVIFIGIKWANADNWLHLLLGSLVGALIFYILANTYAWYTIVAYPKNLAGWFQAQTLGLAGYPPSYLFLKNMIGGNALFSVGFSAIKKIASAKKLTPHKAT